jgi:hypothetical protein
MMGIIIWWVLLYDGYYYMMGIIIWWVLLYDEIIYHCGGRGGHVVLQLPAQSVPITTGYGINTTLSNISAISWQSVLLVKETEVPREYHRPVESHWQALSHNVVLSTSSPWTVFNLITLVVIGTDCAGSCRTTWPPRPPQW